MEPRYGSLLFPKLCDTIMLTTYPEIFLPSYIESNFESLERKRDPVHEIRLSEEEIKKMFPQ